MENLLYYPYINLPRTDWSARALLYYEKIGSIVPENYFHYPERYEPFMRQMVREELVIPINPMDVVETTWRISEIFINYIRSDEFPLEERQNIFQGGRFGHVHRQKFVGSRIHVNKFESEIFYQLSEAGLARRENYEWYMVEEYTASKLMIFLASVIGKKLDFQPVNDGNSGYYDIVGDETTNLEIYRNEIEKREIILRELIPFPEEIDIKKLKAFKEKHVDLLKSFKNKVELIALETSVEINSRLFNERIVELKDNKNELSSKMNENKLGPIFFGTICGATGAFIGLTASTTGAFIGALPGFANAIYSAIQIETPEKIRDQSGLKYLALMDKRIRRNASH